MRLLAARKTEETEAVGVFPNSSSPPLRILAEEDLFDPCPTASSGTHVTQYIQAKARLLRRSQTMSRVNFTTGSLASCLRVQETPEDRPVKVCMVYGSAVLYMVKGLIFS